jgi:N-acetylmuramoyl-L-alanine amidase
MALIKDVTDCSTYAVRGLDNQLIYQMNLIQPSLLVRIDDLDIVLGSAVHPWLQAPAKEALAKAIKTRGRPLTINSAYRTLAGQMLLRSHSREGRCGITAAAPPGKSNHNNASAVDIEDSSGWRMTMEVNSWKWLGAWDAVHYDCVDSRIQSTHQVAVLAFQQLWNLRRPYDQLSTDGDFGPVTASRLRFTPSEGFSGLEVPRFLRLTEPMQIGDDVEELQLALKKAGIAVEIDRAFGPGCDRAVREYQKQAALPIDGIVGVRLRRKLGLSDLGM